MNSWIDHSVTVRAGSPTVLLLHGLAGHRGEWNPVIAQLDPAIGVIAPDQRAHGDRFDPGVNCLDSRDVHVSDAVSLIDAFADGPVVVVGQSMGGIVALLLAHARPDLVSHLVLVEAGVQAMTESDLESLAQWFESWPSRFVGRDDALAFFGQTMRSPAAWVDGLESTASGLVPRFDPAQMLDTMRSLAFTDRMDAWRALTMPTTLIVGADSFVSEAERAAMTEARPETSRVTIADSGHDVHLDQPDEVAGAIAAAATNEDQTG